MNGFFGLVSVAKMISRVCPSFACNPLKATTTAVLLMALTLTGGASGDEPSGPRAAPPAKKATEPKKLTLDEVRILLEQMGYEPKESKDASGKVTSYDIEIHSGTWTIYASVDISPNGSNIWLSWTLKTNVDATAPTEALLAMLALNDDIFPAYITYFPKTKRLWLGYPLRNTDVNAAALRGAITKYAEAVKTSLGLWKKIVETKEKAVEGEVRK